MPRELFSEMAKTEQYALLGTTDQQAVWNSFRGSIPHDSLLQSLIAGQLEPTVIAQSVRVKWCKHLETNLKPGSPLYARALDRYNATATS